MALEHFDFLRCTILAASQAAFNMVLYPEADGLEARLWPIWSWPNKLPLAAGTSWHVNSSQNPSQRARLLPRRLGHASQLIAIIRESAMQPRRRVSPLALN